MRSILVAGLLVAGLLGACGGDDGGSSSCKEGETRCGDWNLEVCVEGKWTEKDCDSECKKQHYSGAKGCEVSGAGGKAVCACESCVGELPDFCLAGDIPVCDSNGAWKTLSCEKWCNLDENGDFKFGGTCEVSSDDEALCGCWDCLSLEDCPRQTDICDWETLRCVDAYQWPWNVTLYAAEVSQTNDKGETWDSPGGLPDLFVVVWVNGEEVFQTSPLDNSLTPTWAETSMLYFGPTDEVIFEVYDYDDWSENEYVGGVGFGSTYGEIPPSVLEAGGFIYEGEYGDQLLSLTVYFEPGF